MKKIIAFIAASTPVVALAQTGQLKPVNNLTDVSMKATDIINLITYFLVAFAVVFIVWNVVMYMIKPDGSEDRKSAGLGILWGIVGLFVIVSIWGLVNILTNTIVTTPTQQAIPNPGNIVSSGGQPANLPPVIR